MMIKNGVESAILSRTYFASNEGENEGAASMKVIIQNVHNSKILLLTVSHQIFVSFYLLQVEAHRSLLLILKVR